MAKPFDRDVGKRMKLVDWVIDRHRRKSPLCGWRVLFLQHQLENHLAQAQALFQLGLETRNLYWIDIPYTSSPEIRQAVIELGVPARNFTTHRYRLTQHYAAYQRARVTRWIKQFMDAHGDKAPLLVLDDGGYFLEALICFRRHFQHLAVVEQTTRGINKYRENVAIQYYCRDVPIVDVATSPPKKLVEPEFIARAVREASGERLQKILGRADLKIADGNVLVLGYGAIGNSVAAEIQERFGLERSRVFVFDTSREKCRKATARGYSVWDPGKYTNEFRLVVGCTGARAFSIWNYVHLAKRSVLISASSGSAEVAREDFVELADSCDVDDIRILDRETLHSRGIHGDITLQLVDHRVTIANGGFPINFDGHLNRIPAEDIQITVAMMVHAAVQAAEAKEARTVPDRRQWLIPLNGRFCREVVNKFSELRDAKGNSLTR